MVLMAKVYGFDDTGPYRGEMLAAQVSAEDLRVWDFDQLAASLDWEFCHTAFSKARAELLTRMQNVGADEEAMRLVRKFKASYVTVTQDLREAIDE